MDFATITFTQAHETQFAGVALEDDAARAGDDRAGAVVHAERFSVLVFDDGTDRVGAADRDRVRLDARIDEALALLATDLHLFGQIVGVWRFCDVRVVWRFAHKERV